MKQLLKILKSLPGNVAEWRVRENQQRELMSCSDRELIDLGLSRSEIRDAVIYGRPGFEDLEKAA